jgi:hypothetical protein
MKKLFNFVAAFIVGTTAVSLISCEDDISDVGSGLLDSGSTANVYYVDVIAYNTNNDSIRSDEKFLQNGILGVYEEPVFGRVKAKFISQARLSLVNPDFGTNPEMDSVILHLPVYTKELADADVDTTYVYLGENEQPSDTATMLIKRIYKLDSIYGNVDAQMTLKVKEVSQYLYSQDSTYYSNPNLGNPNCPSCPNINNISTYPDIIGTATVKKTITTYEKRKKNAPESVPTPSVRIAMNKDYFQAKFLENQNSPDFASQATFIRNVFKGIEISVEENQGFLFNFNPNMFLVMHYKKDDTSSDAPEDAPKVASTYNLSFSSYWDGVMGNNVQVNQFEHANRSSQFVNSYQNPDMVNGASRLYLAGMDGTKTVIKLDQSQLNEIKNNVQNNDWAIVGAELIMHIDDSYGLKKPPYLYAWNSYKEGTKWLDKNFSDVMVFAGLYPNNVQFNPKYDYKENNNTYKIRITDYIKSIVERNEIYEDGRITLSLGNFLLAPSTSFTNVLNGTNPFYSDRAYNPHRIVLHGNATEQDDKKLKLKVYYTKK